MLNIFISSESPQLLQVIFICRVIEFIFKLMQLYIILQKELWAKSALDIFAMSLALKSCCNFVSQ